MWWQSKNTGGLLALGCCVLVLVAVSAHLMHAGPHHSKHGKNILESPDVLGGLELVVVATGFVTPPVLTVSFYTESPTKSHCGDVGLLETAAGRAPPEYLFHER
jgi:hypothetical protein